mmetsp:Transcript_41433/g.84704  ORF Transcript_41433/g.84704 Transcript_41433/m.84704 type:complete len:225 (-) Transcript_41433:467-1141(-)|eukprot:CAMPEP_0181310912 /NCGR_PEP_ID=MMETSP1101-20121128/12849_1 /TAXON_ID=46948 /ORGANISM="Rhodomonas abbreviata, Strain Caron Lab Isolate" /LENGTH=224 /DNA_ID=CAMNT_0023417593 /DNA_START=119 /DNA_END=793 /DNA_ORIENTATION=-
MDALVLYGDNSMPFKKTQSGERSARRVHETELKAVSVPASKRTKSGEGFAHHVKKVESRAVENSISPEQEQKSLILSLSQEVIGKIVSHLGWSDILRVYNVNVGMRKLMESTDAENFSRQLGNLQRSVHPIRVRIDIAYSQRFWRAKDREKKTDPVNEVISSLKHSNSQFSASLQEKRSKQGFDLESELDGESKRIQRAMRSMLKLWQNAYRRNKTCPEDKSQR